MKSFKSIINNLKTGMPLVSQRMSITLFIMCFVVMGCTLIKLKEDVNQSHESTTVVGRIHAKFLKHGPIIVAACSTSEEKEIAHYTVLHDSGEYELLVAQGSYYIFAFWDKNSNLIYEAGEPAGHYGSPKMISVPPVGVVYDIDINIPEGGGNTVIPPGTEISSVQPPKLYSRQAGAIMDLDDELFSEKYGTKGFWEGISFYKQFGGNIYFIEEYDPEKIPILFIHGATGTPKGWRYFVKNIDRTRFQPWFFYYPTGARLNSMSYLLLWKLTNLQTKYQFNQIYITAHSMGGLVARSFLVNYGHQFPYVKLFVSLAAPWGGDRMAEYGVQQSPVVIPSWIDMQPEGDFIRSLYRKKMPETTSFYMLCGHKGSRNPFLSNNDGTITLNSLLDYRAQTEAKMNYVFDEDHASIIYSKDVLAQYNTILDEFEEKQSASLHRSGGYLKITVSYSYDFDGVRPRPIFILRPANKRGAETAAVLGDDGRNLGPFPSGDYLASVVTIAGKSQEKYVPVSIESNKTKEIKFVFKADGVIRGCVTTSLEPEDKAIGMPDYSYRSVDKNINIQSITLKGNSIDRALQPIEGEEINSYDWAISRVDFCYNRCFAFFGLPAGEYKLSINVRGYKPFEKRYSVMPGIPKYFRATELTPD